MMTELFSGKELVEFLGTTPLFKNVLANVLSLLETDLVLVELEEGEVLLNYGEVAHYFYVIMTGTLQVWFKDPAGQFVFVEKIGAGQSVGELAFFTDGKRSASVYALEASRLVRLSKSHFELLSSYHPPALEALYGLVEQRLQQIQLRLALYSSNLFKELSRSELQDLEQELILETLGSGATLLQEGEVADALYIVINGRLRVASSQDIRDEVGRGQWVGELGLLTQGKRRATVYAIRDTLLAKLPQAGFNRLLQQHPQGMMKQFVGTTIRQLMEQSHTPTLAPSNNITTLAIVPLGVGVPLTEFSDRLVVALNKHGATLHLNSSRLNALIGHEGAAQTPEGAPYNLSLIRWLSEQELNYRYVVYETDEVGSLWSYRCLRQADHVILVGHGEQPATVGQIELSLGRHEQEALSAKQKLVLLHGDESHLPQGTEQWLQLHPQVEQHFHIRWGQWGDYERLARFLVGRPVGLVLGGGGARGFAHIGVVRALTELGIPIDFVGGTSIGSVIAAQYALGWSYEEMLECCNKLYNLSKFDLTLPLVSIFGGQKWTHEARTFFADILIENIWIPYFCNSSNLSKTEIVIHQKGLLWQGLRASSGFPGFTPPISYDGDLLVDGGLLSNLPIETMRSLWKRSFIISVDVSPSSDLPMSASFGYKISGWQILWQKINPKAVSFNVPDIISLVYRAATLASTHHVKDVLKQGLSDVYLCPPVEYYGLLDYRSINQIAEVGYSFTKNSNHLFNEIMREMSRN